MRNIKFRAWDTKREQDSEELEWNDEFPEMLDWSYHTGGTFDFFSDDGRFKPMQYTGLKDKNGKEIYEGDILSDLEEKPLYVEYSEEKAAFCFVDQYDPYGTTWYTVKEFHYEGLEIIGNIYEDSHLLN